MSGSVRSGLPIFAVSLSEPAAKCQRPTPRLALAILQYALLACALVALIGSAVMSATDR